MAAYRARPTGERSGSGPLRDGSPRRTGLALREPEVAAGRNHSWFLLRFKSDYRPGIDCVSYRLPARSSTDLADGLRYSTVARRLRASGHVGRPSAAVMLHCTNRVGPMIGFSELMI